MERITGNKANIAHLLKARERGRLSHAYIICGDKGSGKKTFAKYAAKLLLCGGDNAPCGMCASCVKADLESHPDIINVAPEKEVFSVKEVRDYIIDDVSIAPFYGPYKIYIVHKSECMNDAAQNALLKTLEEPPGYVVIMLLCENADALKNTITSRCVRLDMERLSADDIKGALKERQGAPRTDKELSEIAAFSGGNLGRAIELSEGGSLAQLKERAASVMEGLLETDAYDIFKTAEQLEKDDAQTFLSVLLMWIRDLMSIKVRASAREEALYFESEREALERSAKRAEYEGLFAAERSIKKAAERIKYNVKASAALESMLFALRGNLS